MNCNQVQDVLMLYLKNELPVEQKIKTDKHLSGCNICNEELKNLKVADRILISHKNLFEAPEFRRGNKWNTKWKYYISAAAVLIIIATIIRYSSSPEQYTTDHQIWVSNHLDEIIELEYDLYQASDLQSPDTYALSEPAADNVLENINYNLYLINTN